MMKIGIVCDNYKQEAFEAELKKHNFNYEVHDGITKDTKLITVLVDEADFADATEKVKRLSRKIEYTKKRHN